MICKFFFKLLNSFAEKEEQLAQNILKSFEEKSPLYYDILDSMVTELKTKLPTTS